MKNLKPLTPWVTYLDEVGDPIKTEARRLDHRLETLLADFDQLVKDRTDFHRQVLELWRPAEVREARRLSTLKRP